MKGKWKVSRNYVMEETPYIVYRLRDVNKTHHSGNVEYGSDYMASKGEAQRIADRLNAEETDS